MLLRRAGPARATSSPSSDRRARTRVDVEVTTIPADDDPERAIIGDRARRTGSWRQLPIDVTIDSGTVGGPSAGLAFTLAVHVLDAG